MNVSRQLHALGKHPHSSWMWGNVHVSLSEHSSRWKVLGHPHLNPGCAACSQLPYELWQIALRFGYKRLQSSSWLMSLQCVKSSSLVTFVFELLSGVSCITVVVGWIQKSLPLLWYCQSIGYTGFKFISSQNMTAVSHRESAKAPHVMLWQWKEHPALGLIFNIINHGEFCCGLCSNLLSHYFNIKSITHEWKYDCHLHSSIKFNSHVLRI